MTPRPLSPLLALLPALALAPSARSVLHVPADHPTIQAGVDAASDGDVVVVAPGTYVERVDFIGKAITVRSELGPEETTIRSPNDDLPCLPGPGGCRIVRFVDGEGPDSVLDGFTVTGADYGGGIYCTGSPTIRNCIVTDNNIESFGTSGFGAGINGPAYVHDSVISHNVGSRGAGINGALWIENCLIEGNRTQNGSDGGGVYGSPTILRSRIVGNTCDRGNGGGFFATDPCRVVDTVFESNEAGADGRTGGGVMGPATLERCVLVDNWAGSWGGQLTSAGSAVDRAVLLRHCTIVDNRLTEETIHGGAVVHVDEIVGCIIAGNEGASIGSISTPKVSHSLIEGGYHGIGNIDAPPLLLDLGAGELVPLPDSPVVDAGDPAAAPDPDGTVADLGAFPFDQSPACDPLPVAGPSGEALEHLGHRLDALGPYVLLGLPSADASGRDSGTARLLHRAGASWIAQAPLEPASLAPGHRLGSAVALGRETALVGAEGAATAFVFRRLTNGSWAEESELRPPAPTGSFGASAALQGPLAAIGAPLSGAGEVFAFERTSEGWSAPEVLQADGGRPGDGFGTAVALAGGTLLAGAPGADAVAGDAGAVHAYRREGDRWIPEGELDAGALAAGARFGHAVALAGPIAAVGAPGAGTVHVFRRSGGGWEPWEVLASSGSARARFGGALALAGGRLLVGASGASSPAPAAGAAFLYELSGDAWPLTARFAPPGSMPEDGAGSAVALSLDDAIVGAAGADGVVPDDGAVGSFPVPSGACRAPRPDADR